MILFICEPPGFWDEPELTNVKVTTINEIDNDGKPCQTVIVETLDPDKKKQKVKPNFLMKIGSWFLSEKPEIKTNNLNKWDILRYFIAIILIVFLFVMAFCHNKPCL